VVVEPGTAVLHRERHPHQPEIRHFVDQVGRELVGLVDLGGSRDDLLVDELRDGVADLCLLR